MERVRYYADEADTKAHASFALLERWLNAEQVSDSELATVLTRDAYAVYDKRLGTRKRTDIVRRTSALKAAFAHMDKQDTILTRVLTDQQTAKLKQMLKDLKSKK